MSYEDIEYYISTFNYWSKNAEGSIDIDFCEDDPNRTPTTFSFLSPTISGTHEDFKTPFTGQNIEFITDDTPYFRFTVLEIEWESSQEIFIDNAEVQKKRQERAFKKITRVVNDFIEKYRICSSDYFKPTIAGLPFRSIIHFGNINTGQFITTMGLGIRKANYAISTTDHDQLRSLLENPDYLTSSLLSLNSAKYWLSKGIFRNCVLDVVTALEPVILTTVERIWTERGVSPKKVAELTNKVDLHYFVSIEIVQLIDLTNSEQKENFENILSTITLRNKVVHQNFRDVNQKDAINAIESAEQLIDILPNDNA